ncbi:MAG: LCP family protein, partial [Anaerolineales bacterium]|nr:LCP family protein [Anaerolineales bacterium]
AELAGSSANAIVSASATELLGLGEAPAAVGGAPTAFAPLPTEDVPQPLCGGPETMTILALGTDNRKDDYRYGLADVIRVVRVDFITPKVTVLSLPRDIWVEIPAIAEQSGITHGKLNQAFFYGGDAWGYFKGQAGGAGLTARTLKRNFDLIVDNYGVVNMITFERIVDALGGIDIHLDEPVDGTPVDAFTENMGYFPAGDHHFTGDQALRFARIRKRYNDIKRSGFQDMVLCALRKKLASPEVVAAVPEMVSGFRDSVQTDLSLEQITQLACLAPQITRKNIIFTSLPKDLMMETWQYSPQLNGTTFTYAVDQEAVTQLLAEFQSGAWPDRPNEPSCR